MKTKQLIFLISVLTIIVSCSSSNEYLTSQIETFFEKINKQELIPNRGILIVVPIAGCNTCITEALKLSKSNISKNIMVIISSPYKRLIDNYIDDNKLHETLLIKDSTNLASILNLCQTTPVAYFVDNKTAIDSIVINSQTINTIINRIEDF